MSVSSATSSVVAAQTAGPTSSVGPNTAQTEDSNGELSVSMCSNEALTRMDKEASALGGLFQQVLTEMKVGL